MSVYKLLAGSVIAIGLSVAAAAGALAAESHSHDNAASGMELVLNNGAKWATDDALRQGMAAMRDDMVAALPEIHRGGFPPARYAELAGKVDGRIQFLVENCKLTPEADEQLHVILVEIMDAAEAMRSGSDPMQGAARIVQALALYPDYFDHPDWQPLGH